MHIRCYLINNIEKKSEKQDMIVVIWRFLKIICSILPTIRVMPARDCAPPQRFRVDSTQHTPKQTQPTTAQEIH